VVDQLELDEVQRDALDVITQAHGGIVWMNVGDGKTRVALYGVATLQREGQPVVVVVARPASFYDWEQEVATLQLPFTVRRIEDVPMNAVFTKPTILLVSSGMITNGVVQDMLRTLHLSRQWGCFVIDEGWLYKNPQSERSKAVRKWSELGHATILLSGSVMTAKDITDIYGQVAAAGRAKALGRTLTKFRETYMTGINDFGRYSWYPKPGAYRDMMQAIAQFTAIHMPDVRNRQLVERIIKCPLTEQQHAMLKELKETAALEGKFELKNMANIVQKAQQISSGWLYLGENLVEEFDSPKVNRTLALADEILKEPDARVVIWCAYRHDIERLRELMETLCNVAILQGGEAFDHELWQHKDTRICLATEASGSSFNHFAQVPYGIYFSQNYRWLDLQQSQGRHTRRSSLHEKAHFFFMHSEKPALDAQVHYVVKSAVSSEQSFLRQMDLKRWLTT
jgi:hypothetical protein